MLEAGRGTFVLDDAERLTAPRPASVLEETGFRLHPATGFAHSAIEAARSLATLGALDVVRVGVSPVAAALASNPSPQSGEEAWWSIEHAVASALGIDVRRVEVQAATEGWAATVEVRLRDGSVRSASVAQPLGHPLSPASDDDLRAKWTRLTGLDGAAPFERISAAGDGDAFGGLVRELVSPAG